MSLSARHWILAGTAAAAAMLPVVAAQAVPASGSVATNQVIGIEGSDGALWYQASGGGWASLGGHIVTAPAVVDLPNTSGPGTPLFIADTSSHVLWERTPATGWQPLSANSNCLGMPGAVVVGNATAATLYVGCRAPDARLWVNQSGSFAAGTVPTITGSWTDMHGRIGNNVAVAVVGSSTTPTYFASGSNGHIYTNFAGGWAEHPWSCYGHLGAASFGGTSTFACEGTNYQMYSFTNSGASGNTGWSGATALGGRFKNGAAVAMSTTGGTAYYGEGQGRHSHQVYEISGGTITSLGGSAPAGVGAVGIA